MPKRITDGALQELRQNNLRRLEESLRSLGPATQAELARRTGLSKATISNLVSAGIEQGRLRTQQVISSGRRALEVSLANANQVGIGLELGRQEFRLSVVDQDRGVVGEKSWNFAPEVAMGQRLEIIKEAMIVSHPEVTSRNLGQIPLVVALPAPVSLDFTHVISEPIMPGWAPVNLPEQIRQSLGANFYLVNDTNVGALGEGLLDAESLSELTAFVLIDRGIGAGFSYQGKVFLGPSGMAGEIGHITVEPGGPTCICGNRGCLQSVASTEALVTRYFAGENFSLELLGRFLKEVKQGNISACRVLEDGAAALGQALAQVANITDASKFAIASPFDDAGSFYLDVVKQSLQRFVMPDKFKSISVRFAHAGQWAVSRGAAHTSLRLGIQRMHEFFV